MTGASLRLLLKNCNKSCSRCRQLSRSGACPALVAKSSPLCCVGTSCPSAPAAWLPPSLFSSLLPAGPTYRIHHTAAHLHLHLPLCPSATHCLVHSSLCCSTVFGRFPLLLRLNALQVFLLPSSQSLPLQLTRAGVGHPERPAFQCHWSPESTSLIPGQRGALADCGGPKGSPASCLGSLLCRVLAQLAARPPRCTCAQVQQPGWEPPGRGPKGDPGTARGRVSISAVWCWASLFFCLLRLSRHYLPPVAASGEKDESEVRTSRAIQKR